MSAYRVPLRTARPWSRPAPRFLSALRARPELLGVIAVAAILNLWGLGINGWANTFYSAAVRSMASSWHDFLFASLDKSGLMTVDKPPLALWAQALSVRIFGFHPLSILVPQALMGVAAAALIYDLTRRRFGRPAGFVAGVALATTPIAVGVSRHNNPDELLVLCCVAALWFVVRALEDGRTRWLVLSGICVGLGFETKMAVALFVVPGIALAYLWVAPSRQRPTRHPASPDRAARESSGCRIAALRQLSVGGIAMAVVGLAWPLLVTLTPTADRPWISGTSDNSIWSLIFNYNGVGRVTGQTGAPTAGLRGGGGGSAFGGATGVFRLLQSGLGDQAGWLLGFAIVAGLGVLVATRMRRRDPRTGWLIAVGGAFAVTAVVFSYAGGIFHPYYVSFLAPFTAALIGAGVGQIVSGGRAARILAPAALVAGAITELVVLGNISGDLVWAKPLVIGLVVIGAVALALRLSSAIRMLVLAVALAALMAAPATWAAETLGHATSATFPAGGPASAAAGGFGGPGGRHGFAGGRRLPFGGPSAAGAPGVAEPSASAAGAPGVARPFAGGVRGRSGSGAPGGPGGAGFGGDTTSLKAAVRYADTHGGGTLGVESQSSAAAAILSSRATVAGLGGFSGRESSVSASWLAMEVRDGRLRWILAEGDQGFAGPRDSRQGSSSALSIAERVGTRVTLTSNGTQITMYDLKGKAAEILAAAGRS